MKSFLLSLWHRLSRDLRLQLPTRRTYQLDEPFAEMMQSLAERERRSVDEVTGELLSLALAQRSSTDEILRLWNTLTAREQQVVALSCLGYSTLEVAQRLIISKQTVKAHQHSATKKFGLKSKAQLLQLLRDFDFSAWGPPT